MDMNTPIWQLTVGEFLELSKKTESSMSVNVNAIDEKYVFGLNGIAELFGCSKSTAQTIKNSGKINKAVTQVGRKIVVDAKLALELYNKKTR